MLLLLLLLLFQWAGSLVYPEEKLCFFSVTLFASTWEAYTSTTNPVESINRESVPKDGRQKSLVEVLSPLYRVDKVYVAKRWLQQATSLAHIEIRQRVVKKKDEKGKESGGVEAT